MGSSNLIRFLEQPVMLLYKLPNISKSFGRVVGEVTADYEGSKTEEPLKHNTSITIIQVKHD